MSFAFGGALQTPAAVGPQGVPGPTGQMAVLFASTGAVTTTGTQTVDDVSSGNGEKALIKNEGNPALNGIYITNSSGAWTRISAPDVYRGLNIFVRQGTVNGNTNWQLQGLDEPYSPGDIFSPTPMPNSESSSITVSDWKPQVRLASTGPQDLFGLEIVDGKQTAEDDDVLIWQQGSSDIAKAFHGIWVVKTTDWERRSDADTAAKMPNGFQVQVKAGDTYAGRSFRLTGSPESYTVGTDPLTFEPLPTNGSVDTQITTAVANIVIPSRTIAAITEDWTSMLIPGGGSWVDSGTGTADVDTSSGNPGQVVLSTSTGGTYHQIRTGAAWVLEGQDVYCETAVYLNALSTSTNRYKAAHGLHGTDGVAIQDDGCYWLYNEAVSPNWFAHVVNGAEDYPGDSGVAAVAGSFVYFRLVVNRNTAVGSFYINGALVVTIPDFFPSTPLFPAAVIERTSGTIALRTMKIDYHNTWQARG